MPWWDFWNTIRKKRLPPLTSTGAPTLSRLKAVSRTITVVPVATVAAPVIAPPDGTYTDRVTVTMDCATIGAAIHYTLDGSEPTLASSRYTQPLELLA